VASSTSSEEAVCYRGITSLITLKGAAEKKARHIQTADLSPIHNAAMLVRAGKIIWAGNESECPLATAHRIDLGGAVVIPALVESHTHLVFAGNRAAEFERRNQGESYLSIGRTGGGIQSTVRSTRAASFEDLVNIGQMRIERYLKQGVATIEIKSGYGLSFESEAKMLRAAGQLKRARVVRTFLGAHAQPKEFTTAKDYIHFLITDCLPKIKAERLAERADIFVEDGYFDREVARTYLKSARELGFDLVIHADQLTRSGGAELAIEFGARSAEHLLCINQDDIAALSQSEVTCVLLPNSDFYMNCHYPPARALIDQGARIALATDFNPGSSPTQDVALVGILARVQMKLSFAEVLAAYTVGAAFALGLEKELGSLEVGKSADFAVLEGELEEIFLEVGRMPVRQLYRAGVALL